MKVYELTTAYGTLAAGTKLYGPFPLLASHVPAYFTEDSIPPEGQQGINGFFQSAVEGDKDLFKLIDDGTQKTPA